MHLLAATPGSINDGTEPVDLGQTPAEVVVISAADTELAMLAEARAAMDDPPGLRLASLLHLMHPMSVDLHLDQCATKARLVIVRLLGGSGYWRYGFEQYAARLHEAGVAFAALPGDDKPDPELRQFSTVSDGDYDALWAYLVEGGAENGANFLAYARKITRGTPAPVGPRPLLRAGVYWPGEGATTPEAIQGKWRDGAPIVPIIFYRALVQGAGLHPINRLCTSLLGAGMNPLPIFVASLKDPLSQKTLDQIWRAAPPDVILNATAFAASAGDMAKNPLAQAGANDAPVFQVILSGGSEETWAEGTAGLGARDIAMNVALPELDGRVLARAISFKGEAYFDEATQCPIATYRAQSDRIDFVTQLSASWARLRRTKAAERKVALVLANYPNKDGRLANGVGLDTPAATQYVLEKLRDAGYRAADLPQDAQELMRRIMSGPTNWYAGRAQRSGGVCLAMRDYEAALAQLPLTAREQINDRWGPPEEDPFFDGAGFRLSILTFGNLLVGVQPARGYNIDPVDSYHSPDLVPPHNYLAFYFWLRFDFAADAIVHMGKHGNLEWLPGKSVALSQDCWPEIALGPVPHIYPFIVNDPGEGTQAKRRASAVIIDHLTPPLTRAESYGPMRELEGLVDEYYEAAGLDPNRLEHLRREILSLSEVSGLAKDAGLIGDGDSDLGKLDAYLCELKEAQIRDGLHIFGQSPEGDLLRDLAIALVRIPRADGADANQSLIRAIAQDLELGFDPLDCALAGPYAGPRPAVLGEMTGDAWRTLGDTVERVELLAQALVSGQRTCAGMDLTSQVMGQVRTTVIPRIEDCGPAEMAGLLRALSGRFVAPAPSGAPSRGRLDVLPTGRNFFSVDGRAVPTPTAWALGWKSASLLLERHLQDHGDWPRAMLLSAWGTANMRTGGDDIAQALALMGVKPKWDTANRRVTGFEIIPITALGRPRVDVTLRISGFFRDAFPQLISLVDSAARAVQELDEPEDLNPAAARMRGGASAARVYGSKPGSYGAGLQALIDERIWDVSADLGEAYLEWGGYAYGAGAEGHRDREGLEQRLGDVEAIVHNQDNREHDILDSDDYYQFEGGASAAVEKLQGARRPIYHNDHSRPERPVIRSLEDEIGRVVRSRAVNPKWIEGVKRHGYKGAFEMAATLDYLFAFSATTGAVSNHHFDLLEQAYLADDETRKFIADANPAALTEMAQRFREAMERGLWTPRSNSARTRIDAIISAASG